MEQSPSSLPANCSPLSVRSPLFAVSVLRHPDRSGRFSLLFAPRERRPRSGGTVATFQPSANPRGHLPLLRALCVSSANGVYPDPVGALSPPLLFLWHFPQLRHPDRSGRFFLARRTLARRPRSGGTVATLQPNPIRGDHLPPLRALCETSAPPVVNPFLLFSLPPPPLTPVPT